MSGDVSAQARAILERVKPLAIEYYHLTKRPLGIMGELAELVVAKEFNLEINAARTAGYDALRNGTERIQIKGRALAKGVKAGRMSRIKVDADFDAVILVIFDLETLEPTGMWEASRQQVQAMLTKTKANARVRGQLSIAEFRREAKVIWPPTEA